jgi:hypothetical protein
MGASSKKPFVFWQVSDKFFCLICNKALKLNLLAKVSNAKFCYLHNKQNIAIKKDMKSVERERMKRGKPIY